MITSKLHSINGFSINPTWGSTQLEALFVGSCDGTWLKTLLELGQHGNIYNSGGGIFLKLLEGYLRMFVYKFQINTNVLYVCLFPNILKSFLMINEQL